MSCRCASKQRQSGVALFLFLVLLVLAGSYAFYRTANVGNMATGRDGALTASMARAKEALIAYAVTDDLRLGRLLCPDLIGDGISPKLSRNDCDAYAGWLPWKTLDLGDGVDDHGTLLRYVALRWFGGDRVAPPINSDTLSTKQLADASILQASLPAMPQGLLFLDTPVGSGTNDLSNDIVALIIAPRGKLDSRNADGDNYYFTGQSDHEDDNDFVMPVTRQELMAAVEKRVAGELKVCLEGHAKSSPDQTYPWPAPLSNSIYKGVTKALFGMVPDTQPGNVAETLNQAITDLSSAEAAFKNALNSGSTATILESATTIQTLAASIRQLFDRVYLLAARVVDSAKAAEVSFDLLKASIRAITANNTAFSTNKDAIPDTISGALTPLDTFQLALADSGFDLFLMELNKQNDLLATRIQAANQTPSTATFRRLKTQIDVFGNNLFERSLTPNQYLTQLISEGLTAANKAASSASAAAANPYDPKQIKMAIDDANALWAKNSSLNVAVVANRVNVDGNEFSYLAERIQVSLNEFVQTTNTETANALNSRLLAAEKLTKSISTSAGPVLIARNATLPTLELALKDIKGNDHNLTIASATQATATLQALAEAILANGENIAKATLANAKNMLLPYSKQPAAKRQSTKNDLLPVIDDVRYWAVIGQVHAADIARVARKSTWAEEDSSTSAYTQTSQLLASLDGEKGTLNLIENALSTQTPATNALALTAVQASAQLLSQTITTANRLEKLLETSWGDGSIPIKWLGDACRFLQPPTGNTASWWAGNAWNTLIFYQISDRTRPTTGNLTVNGSGAYRLIVISAGRALYLPKLATSLPDPPAGKQNRNTRSTINFFECTDADKEKGMPILCNNHISRDGNANNPDKNFWNTTVSPLFNDRLAY